jgi:mono/diheme cytochrome c family protein
MPKVLIPLFVFGFLLLFSCKTKTTVVPDKDVTAKYFNNNRLPSQLFEINIGKDTVLISAAGMKINIPAGALQSSSNKVMLEVKEAFTIEAIVAAGLTTTTSDGRPLSSNGMFYINVAAGQEAKLVKALTINTPSNEFNPNAQLYDGIENEGNISWQNPKPVLENGALNALALGKNLFTNNCASCHKIDKALIGPALLHVTKRLPRQWLYDFTSNWQQLCATGDCYANTIINYDKSAMTVFEGLDSQNLKSLYDYIDQESNRIEPGRAYEIPEAMPRCEEYFKDLNELQAKRDAVEINNGSMSEVTQVQPPNSINNNNTGEPLKVNPNDYEAGNRNSDKDVELLKINSDNYDAVNYKFEVNAFGWYNIDFLLEDDKSNVISILRIQVAYAFKANFNTFLLIPKRKIFQEGGKLSDEKYYGFNNVDGTIPLPQNENCIVFAVGESEDGKPVFGKMEFKAAKSQTLKLQMQAYSEVEVKRQLSLLPNGDGFTTGILQTESFKEISAIDTAMNALKAKWANKCNCYKSDDSAMPQATTPAFSKK